MFTASTNGVRFVFTRNLGGITMDADDVEDFHLNALGGADSITINDLTATDVRIVDLALGSTDLATDAVTVNGSGAADAISMFGGGGLSGLSSSVLTLGIVEAEPLLDTLTVSGLAGADLIGASSLAATSVSLTLNGGLGADVLVGSPGAATVSGDAGDDLIQAGDSNDIIDGGADSDVCDGGAGIDVGINCETTFNIP